MSNGVDDCACCSQSCSYYEFGTEIYASCSALNYCDNGNTFFLYRTDFEQQGCTEECPVPEGTALWIWWAVLIIMAMGCCCAICNCFIKAHHQRVRERRLADDDEDEARERLVRMRQRFDRNSNYNNRNRVIQGEVCEPVGVAQPPPLDSAIAVGVPGDQRRASVLSFNEDSDVQEAFVIDGGPG